MREATEGSVIPSPGFWPIAGLLILVHLLPMANFLLAAARDLPQDLLLAWLVEEHLLTCGLCAAGRRRCSLSTWSLPGLPLAACCALRPP